MQLFYLRAICLEKTVTIIIVITEGSHIVVLISGVDMLWQTSQVHALRFILLEFNYSASTFKLRDFFLKWFYNLLYHYVLVVGYSFL